MTDQPTTDKVVKGAIPSTPDARDQNHAYVAKTKPVIVQAQTSTSTDSGFFGSLLKAILNLFSFSWWRSLFGGGTYSPNATTLPASFTCDMSKLPPVFSQREEDCVANGLAAMMVYSGRQMPSRDAIWWGARSIEGTTMIDTGVQTRDALKTVMMGVPSEAEWPYIPMNWRTQPPNTTTVSISEYQSINQVQHDICDAIYNGQLVGIGLTIYKSMEYVNKKNSLIPIPTAGDKELGGHFMVVVGWTPEYAIVRNSWGPKWGDQGYAHMPWSMVLNPVTTYDIWIIS